MRNDAPVVVTALGGSGTRIVAAILAAHGVYLGECFNSALDNLWLHFLLFKRDPFGEFEKLRPMIELFARRMRSPNDWNDDAVAAVLDQRQWLTRAGIEVDANRNLAQACDSLLTKPDKAVLDLREPWGFKYPPGYLYAPCLFDVFPGARMVFLTRHPLDMAFSPNQNQLRRFGHWLGTEVELTPRWQLKLWLKAYDYVLSLSKQHPVHFVNFEALISQPAETISDLFGFLGLILDPTTLKVVHPPDSIGRYRRHSLTNFDREDLERISGLGFTTGAEQDAS